MKAVEAMTLEELEHLQAGLMASRAELKAQALAVQAELDHRAQVAAFVKAGGDAEQVRRPG